MMIFAIFCPAAPTPFAPLAEDPTTTMDDLYSRSLAMILRLPNNMPSFQPLGPQKKEISIDGWKVDHHHVQP